MKGASTIWFIIAMGGFVGWLVSRELEPLIGFWGALILSTVERG
jgi:hypothetical protein